MYRYRLVLVGLTAMVDICSRSQLLSDDLLTEHKFLPWQHSRHSGDIMQAIEAVGSIDRRPLARRFPLRHCSLSGVFHHPCMALAGPAGISFFLSLPFKVRLNFADVFNELFEFCYFVDTISAPGLR